MNYAPDPGWHPTGRAIRQRSNDRPGRQPGEPASDDAAQTPRTAPHTGGFLAVEAQQLHPGAHPALSAALPRFLRRCDAESTRLAYERELLRFIAWLPERPGPEVLFDYRDHLRARGLGPTTIRWRTTVARAFLQFAEREGYLPPTLAGDFRPPRGHSGFVPRVLTQRELERLLAAPDRRSRRGRRDAAILVCLGVGGLRAGEVCALDAEDLLIRSDAVVLTVNGKGRKRRLVSLPARWAELFRGYLRSWPDVNVPGASLFRCVRPGTEARRLTVPSVDYVVRHHATAAHLAGISAHCLRHTAASLAIDAGEPLHRLRDRLGHSSVLVTSRYLHVAGGITEGRHP
jgi:integrase/recombinase XerD